MSALGQKRPLEPAIRVADLDPLGTFDGYGPAGCSVASDSVTSSRQYRYASRATGERGEMWLALQAMAPNLHTLGDKRFNLVRSR
jgi:hypothetical protein